MIRWKVYFEVFAVAVSSFNNPKCVMGIKKYINSGVFDL
jgi:hypothetical protein